jgi:polyisoprenoid-binding protein YceI
VLSRAAVVAAFLSGATLAVAAAQPVTPAPLGRGEVTFVIHSTFVGRILGRAPVARAEFSGDQLGTVRGSAEVDVAQLATGNGTRDRHMREAMDADSYPTIRFDLVGVQPGAMTPDSTVIILEGRLSLRGVTKPVSAQGSVILRADGADVTASFALDMRDYGITPPVRALVLRVAPDVVVTAHLSFASRPGPGTDKKTTRGQSPRAE